MSSPAAEANPRGGPAPVSNPKLSVGKAADYDLSAMSRTDVVAVMKDPRFLAGTTLACTLGFFTALIYSFITPQIDFNALDPSNLKVWWLGSILSSAVFLLLFFVVFRNSPHFNRAVVFLLLTTFVILHVSLLLTQINLTL